MNMKFFSILLIGIILGGSAGYSVSLIYTPQILEDVLPNNYKTRYDELLLRYQNLTDNYGTAVSDLEKLQENYKALFQEHENLTEGYAFLTEELGTLKEEHKALSEAYNETLESYDSLLMQYQIITGSAPLSPQPVSNDTIRKDFAWSYEGKTWTLSLYVPQYLYYYYKNRTRIPTQDYSVYVTHPHDDEYLSTIAEKFNDIALEENYDEGETVNIIIAFVQSLPYTPDDVSTSLDEYPRYPLETLVDGGGDCEDTSILISAILDTMDYNVVLIDLPGHMAVGVDAQAYGTYWLHDGTKYFYVETTGEGWEIGELPTEYEGESAQIYPILPIPVCTHDWTASIVRHRLTLVADIRNVGTAEATGIKLFAGFEGKGNEVLNPTESTFFDIEIGEETTVVLEIRVPRDIYTRIIVRVLDPWGNVMDESYSEWFDTD